MARKTVDLNALIENDGGEIVIDGAPYRVLPMSGATIQLYETETDSPLKKAYDVAALCVPSLAREQLDHLTPKQIGKIVELALEDVDAVKAEHAEANPDPNAAAPAAATSSSPA